jgi:uncharacterized protein with PIN domain
MTQDQTAEFRFYEELNDFLPAGRRKRTFVYNFRGTPAVKDVIEGLGVPHTEVDLIIVDGRSVGFDYRLMNGNRVAVYPRFESVDIAPLTRLSGRPLRTIRFIVDIQLGRLARLLRMLGFDTALRKAGESLLDLSLREQRIILTRDRGILKVKAVTHGCCVHSSDPREQLREVVRRFDLRGRVRPFARCMACNGSIHAVARDAVLDRLPKRTAQSFDEFYQCASCGKVYWKGSHYDRMRALVEALVEGAD